MEAALIPLSQLVPELLLALGGAFLLGNLAAYVRLRPAWREAKQARQAQLETAPDGEGAEASGAEASGAAAAGARAGNAKAAAAKAPKPRLPSRTRVLANVIAGLLVTVASLAALISRG